MQSLEDLLATLKYKKLVACSLPAGRQKTYEDTISLCFRIAVFTFDLRIKGVLTHALGNPR